jgi:hypothetical protein
MKLKNSLIIGCVAVVSACSGSNDGDNTVIPPVVGNAIVIESSNALDVAKMAAGAALESNEFGGMTGVLGLSAGSQGGVAKTENAAMKIAQSTLDTSRQKIPVGPIASECDVGGFVTISGDLADPLTYTAGDTLSVDSMECDDGTGAVVDGLLEMTITAFSGDLFTGLFNIGIEMLVTDFSVTEGGETETANGDMGTMLDTSTPPVSEGSVFGDSFSIAGPTATESLRNFSTIYTEEMNVADLLWTVDAMGTVDSSELAGSVTYDTPVIFLGTNNSYPHTGELLVTGDGGSTLHLVTIDDVNVRIDADYDGDTVIDESFDLTWAELNNEPA